MLLHFVVARATRPRTLWRTLAVTSFVLFIGALTGPWWLPFLEAIVRRFWPELQIHAVNQWIVVLLLGTITVVFIILARVSEMRDQRNDLIATPVVHKVGRVGEATVYSFCGSVRMIRNVSVVVTSENQNLTLGNPNGTSVSGRVRDLAATKDAAGAIIVDNLQDFVEHWKNAQPHRGPYELGLCIPAPAFSATNRGIESVVLAIALFVGDDGKNQVNEVAIDRIIAFAIRHCDENSYNSLFIPTFGLGNGRLPARERMDATVAPLVAQLRDSDVQVDIYVGTYRLVDSMRLVASMTRHVE